MSVRAKIYVMWIKYNGTKGTADAEVAFGAVYSNNPDHENRTFWRYSPNMNFTMTLSKEAVGALTYFEDMLAKRSVDPNTGQMYLDFTEAPVQV